ncbi:MAG: alpha/beta fold hydrolase, partial [Coxiellaceae bacterium]|nr:alpha/beta fold hydrolase [Coxiellaceae bacterium]
SDKPDIEYSIFDHIRYVEAFIAKLGLKNITLVLHGWGSVIGFHYAMEHQENVKGIAFYESHVRATISWDMLSLPVQQMASIFTDQDTSYREVMVNNFFINTALPTGILRQLTDEEMKHYAEPFKTKASRKPLMTYVQELPVGSIDDDVMALIRAYSAKLKESTIPKLMFYAVPGFITTIENVQWAKENFPNLELKDLGEALHFIQETNPLLFAHELDEWYLSL